MKPASFRHGRERRLAVVADDLSHTDIVPTRQTALDDGPAVASRLAGLQRLTPVPI